VTNAKTLLPPSLDAPVPMVAVVEPCGIGHRSGEGGHKKK
jgi:hypothetical protein